MRNAGVPITRLGKLFAFVLLLAFVAQALQVAASAADPSRPNPGLLTFKVTSPNAANLSDFASRYDLIYGSISHSLIDDAKAVNSDIILLDYTLPAGARSKTGEQESFYVRDATSGLKIVNNNGWWLLDMTQAAVRETIAGRIAQNLPEDGEYLDVSDPSWPTQASEKWQDEYGKPADLPFAIDAGSGEGGWPDAMLKFHQTLKSKLPSEKLHLFNSLRPRPGSAAVWATWEQRYLDATNGAQLDGVLWNRNKPMPERDWKFQIDRANQVASQGKLIILKTNVTGLSKFPMAQVQTFVFASFLLIANGTSTFLRPEGLIGDAVYDQALYGVNIGSPSSSYFAQNGVYIRNFTNGQVLVNPSGSTRTGGGKTLGPYSAMIILTAPAN